MYKSKTAYLPSHTSWFALLGLLELWKLYLEPIEGALSLTNGILTAIGWIKHQFHLYDTNMIPTKELWEKLNSEKYYLIWR